MADDSAENSTLQSLYEFRINDKAWRYTNGREPVFMNGFTWAPFTISDSGSRQKGDVQADLFEITCQSDMPIVAMYMSNPPSAETQVTARRFEIGETESEVYFVGSLSNVDMPLPGRAVLSCTAVSASLEREGLRLTWSRTCPYSLYDADCRVDRSMFAIPATILTSVNGIVTVQTLVEQDNGWLDGGFIEWVDPTTGLERRGIESQIGNELVMFGTSAGLNPGMNVAMYPGCNRTTDHCKNKFSNIANYGGVPQMPGRSPFDGDPVF